MDPGRITITGLYVSDEERPTGSRSTAPRLQSIKTVSQETSQRLDELGIKQTYVWEIVVSAGRISRALSTGFKPRFPAILRVWIIPIRQLYVTRRNGTVSSGSNNNASH